MDSLRGEEVSVSPAEEGEITQDERTQILKEEDLRSVGEGVREGGGLKLSEVDRERSALEEEDLREDCNVGDVEGGEGESGRYGACGSNKTRAPRSMYSLDSDILEGGVD